MTKDLVTKGEKLARAERERGEAIVRVEAVRQSPAMRFLTF